MTTVTHIITRALTKAGVVGKGEAAPAEELQDGVYALNEMLAAWKLAGVDTSATPLEATDTFPMDPEFEEGTIYNLASRMAPEYTMPQMFDADDWFRKIQAAYMVIDDVVMPSSILFLPSRQRDRY